MTEENSCKSPNEQLAERVVVALQESDLLKPERAEEALKKLKAGKVTRSDWRIWAEEYVTEAVSNG